MFDLKPSFCLDIAKDSARQSSHYVDPQKAIELLQDAGHYSKRKENFAQKDTYEEDEDSKADVEGAEEVLSHISESDLDLDKSQELVFPNGEGVYFQFFCWMCFIFGFLDISLASLRESEKSVEIHTLRFSPVPQWIKDLSYVLSTDDEKTPMVKKSGKKRKQPDSCEKGVGTSGSRKSKRIMNQHLSASKSGKQKFSL